MFLEKLPFFALSAASCVVTLVAQRQAIAPQETFPVADRVANALVSCSRYAGKAVWPVDLVAFYPLPSGQRGEAQWPLWLVFGACLFLVLVTALVLRVWRRRPWLVTGWFWFLGTLVPVIGIVQVGTQAMADRYTYIPLIGLFIGPVWGAQELCSRVRSGRLMLSLAAVPVLLACAWAAHRQVAYWKDDFTLWDHTLAVTRSNVIAHYNLGNACLQLGEYARARDHFQAALRLDPAYAAVHCNLGVALMQLRQPDAAIEEYRTALRLRPDLTEVRNYLAPALLTLGRTAEALEQYAALAREQPANAEARENLGRLYAGQGRLDEAVREFEEQLRLRPDAQAHYNLGLARVMQGRLKEGVAHYEEAVRLKPDWPVALNDLAWLRATAPEASLRDGAEAVRLAERACELSGGREARFYGTLDAAYAEAGRFGEAMATAEKAREMALAAGDKDTAAAAEHRLARYRQRQPWRQTH